MADYRNLYHNKMLTKTSVKVNKSYAELTIVLNGRMIGYRGVPVLENTLKGVQDDLKSLLNKPLTSESYADLDGFSLESLDGALCVFRLN